MNIDLDATETLHSVAYRVGRWYTAAPAARGRRNRPSRHICTSSAGAARAYHARVPCEIPTTVVPSIEAKIFDRHNSTWCCVPRRRVDTNLSHLETFQWCRGRTRLAVFELHQHLADGVAAWPTNAQKLDFMSTGREFPAGLVLYGRPAPRHVGMAQRMPKFSGSLDCSRRSAG